MIDHDVHILPHAWSYLLIYLVLYIYLVFFTWCN